MARRRVSKPAEPTAPTPTRHVPEACPLCGEAPTAPKGMSLEAVLREHLEQHRPAQLCTRRHDSPWAEKEPPRTWELSWESIQYYRPDVSPWYCTTCGVHAPVTT